MKAWLFAAGLALLAAGALSPIARAEGPRPSSENNWPGISDQYVPPPAVAETAPRYVWQEGYEHGGRWRGHWVIVR